jgi:hypothetical protein
MSAPASVRVVRFFAGEVRLAISARAVKELSPADPAATHIATRLGLPGSSPLADSTARLITISSGERQARFVVDGPIAMWAVGQEDLLDQPGILEARQSDPVLGVARDGDHLVLLLRPSALVEGRGGSG